MKRTRLNLRDSDAPMWFVESGKPLPPTDPGFARKLMAGVTETVLAFDGSLAERFAAILDSHGARTCPSCERDIGLVDLAWNNAATEGGTDYTTIEIICDVCQAEIACIHSWEHAGTTREVIGVLEREWTIRT